MLLLIMESGGGFRLFIYLGGSRHGIFQIYIAIVFLNVYSGEKKIKRKLSENVGVGSNSILSMVLFWSYDTYILAITFIPNSLVPDIQMKCFSAWHVGRTSS